VERFFFGGSESSIWPPVDIFEDQDYLIYEADVPGSDPEDIVVKVVGDLLIIEGKRREPELESRSVNYICLERTSQGFRRVLNIPTPVDVTSGSALYQKGVLTVTFTKLQNRVHRIPVKRNIDNIDVRLKREVVNV